MAVPEGIAFQGVDVVLGGRLIVQDVSFAVGRGQVGCIIGPSGCGKTTLLRLVAGLAAPARGDVRVGGRIVAGPSRSVAVVFQDYGRALLPWRSVAGNVALALEAIGAPRREHAGRIEALLETVGLIEHREKFPAQLSGGMQQRLQIARCLAQSPDVLLMDEPFGALDAMTRQGLQDEVLALAAERGITVFFVTHDLEEAIYLGDKVVALEARPGRVGRVVDVALSRPRHQLSTREAPEFLRLRRALFDLVAETHR